MKRGLIICSIFFAVFLFAGIAIAQQKPVYGGSLTIAQGVEPPGLDPTTATSAAIPRVVYTNVLEGLLKIDRDGKIVPAVAIDVKTSKDGKEVTFRLKKGVKFHDGKVLDAEDVKFSLERMMDPKTAAPNIAYYR